MSILLVVIGLRLYFLYCFRIHRGHSHLFRLPCLTGISGYLLRQRLLGIVLVLLFVSR